MLNTPLDLGSTRTLTQWTWVSSPRVSKARRPNRTAAIPNVFFMASSFVELLTGVSRREEPLQAGRSRAVGSAATLVLLPPVARAQAGVLAGLDAERPQ